MSSKEQTEKSADLATVNVHLPTTHVHVLTIPLQVNQQQAYMIDQRLQACGKLANAVRGDLLGRVTQMKRDPIYRRWVQKEKSSRRTAALNFMCKKYYLTSYGAQELARQHWRDSIWMMDLFDSHTANSIGADVWVPVQEFMFKKAGRPRFKPAVDMNMIWGTSQQGVTFDNDRIEWGFKKRPGHRLHLELDCFASHRAKYLPNGEEQVQRAGIKREVVRGKTRYFALLYIKGPAYRNPEYLASLDPDSWVGFDQGPSKTAVVGENESFVIDRATPEIMREVTKAAARKRRQG